MATLLYKSHVLHDGNSGTHNTSGLSIIPSGANDMGPNPGNTWNQQSLGAGHLAFRDGSDVGPLLGWTTVPPSAFSSAASGHGGKMARPEWPVGRVWDGMNALGGYDRLRYRFRGAVGVVSGDLLTWGPVSIGLRQNPSNLGVSTSLWGVEYFIGDRTGDGSLFPNPGLEDGWGIRWRFAPLGSLVESSELMGTGQGMHYVEFVYVDQEEPILRCRFDNVIRDFDGADFTAITVTDSSMFGPAIDGAACSARSTVEIHTLAADEDPFDGELEPQFIVTSTDDAVMDTNEAPLTTYGEPA